MQLIVTGWGEYRRRLEVGIDGDQTPTLERGGQGKGLGRQPRHDRLSLRLLRLRVRLSNGCGGRLIYYNTLISGSKNSMRHRTRWLSLPILSNVGL